MVGYRTRSRSRPEGSAELGIVALGIAIVYLLAVAAGFTGALLVLVWLFGEAPGAGAGTGREEAVGGSRGAARLGVGGTTASPSAGPDARRTRPRETARIWAHGRDPTVSESRPRPNHGKAARHGAERTGRTQR